MERVDSADKMDKVQNTEGFGAKVANCLKSKGNHRFSRMLRGVATFVLVAFVTVTLHDFVYASPALQATAITGKLYLPPRIGKIVDRFQGSSKQKIILIQDLHCHPGVQRNINEIIGTAKRVYGKKLKVIGVEGTRASIIDTSILANIPHTGIRKRVVDHFVDRGDISGGELYTILSDAKDVKAYGIEYEPLYRKNFNTLYTSLPYRKKISDIVAKTHKGFNRAKQYLYTQEAIDIEKTIKNYHAGRITLEKHLLFLKEKSNIYKIPFERYCPELKTVLKSFDIKKTLKPRMIAMEAKYIVNQTGSMLSKPEQVELNSHKEGGTEEYYMYLKDILKTKRISLGTNYMHMQQYFAYLDTVASIDDIKMIEEREMLEYRIMEKALKNRTDGSKLLYCQKYLGLFEDYVWNRVSSTNAEEWRAQEETLHKTVNDLGNRVLYRNYFEDAKDLIEQARKNMDNFYHYAEKRNELLIKNILKTSKKEKSTITVAVVGGYHRKGMQEVLKGKSISYDVVMPTVDSPYDDSMYMRRVNEQAGWYKEAVEKKLIATKTKHGKYQNAVMVNSMFSAIDDGENVGARLQSIIPEVIKQISVLKKKNRNDFISNYNKVLPNGSNITIDSFKKGSVKFTFNVEGKKPIIIEAKKKKNEKKWTVEIKGLEEEKKAKRKKTDTDRKIENLLKQATMSGVNSVVNTLKRKSASDIKGS